MLVTEFGGIVPKDMDSLLKMPGVGRKIANLLLGDIYGLPAVVCDTHFIRIMGRVGMYPENEKDPFKIEMKMRELMDLERGSDFCHRVVIFGREICTARSPQCARCPIKELCKRELNKKER
jgi:endonuclease-3